MNRRLEAFSTGPALVAISIVVVTSIVATFGTHPIAMFFVALIGALLVMITIDTGGHSMAMFSGAFLLMALALAIGRLSLDGAVPWAAAGVVLLGFGDAVRLSFAQRRLGVVDAEVHRGVVVGLIAVAVASGFTAFVVAGLSDANSNVNWLLVPLALALAVVGVVGLAVAVSRSPGQFDKRRWKPGERLMPPPRDASDDPSFKTSTPPPPR